MSAFEKLMRTSAALVLPLALALLLGGGRRAEQAGDPADRPTTPRGGIAPARQAPRAELPPGALSPRNASYSIDAALDTTRRVISGREVLTWRNTTSAPTSELRFHLYWNAWKHSRTTWLRGRRLAGTAEGVLARPEREWAWTDVTALRLLGLGAAPPIDLTAAARFIAPDDGNPDDRTVMRVPLPAAVGPGETINVEVEWTAQVPRTFARTGAIGDFFFIAHWFPKVGVLEEGGWNAHQFHAGTEFYADYGVYDVRLRVPAGWVVGATGTERARRDNGDGTVTHRYVQEDVHDFAWTTSPDFEERRARFEHPTLPPVEMRLLLQPEHARQADRHFDATRAALRYYGEWFGPYPYGHITIVDPAWQSGAGGMEYPTLFTAGTRWLAPRGVVQPESVTIHEAGHQFWYGIVGNNEFEHAWIDEGINTFATARTIAEVYDPHYLSERFFGGFVPWVYRDIPLSRATHGNRLATYRPAARSDVPATPSYRYFPATGGRITYDKTALWLYTLERMLGWPALQRILSTFFERYAFAHPGPDDFFAIVAEVAEQDLTWFFDQVFHAAAVFDYGVADLQSHPRRLTGFVNEQGTRRFVRDEARDNGFETTVVVRRHADGVFPVDVLVTFEDGTSVRERWDGRDTWRTYTYERPSRAVSAIVDPDRVLILDLDYTNNSRTLAPLGNRAATGWSLRWLVWLQDLMLTYGFFV
jgi:hypothetical protein